MNRRLNRRSFGKAAIAGLPLMNVASGADPVRIAVPPELISAAAAYRAAMDRVADLSPTWEAISGPGTMEWAEEVWMPACRAQDEAGARLAAEMERSDLNAVVVEGRLYMSPHAMIGLDGDHPPSFGVVPADRIAVAGTPGTTRTS
jgi:hypothetical protein